LGKPIRNQQHQYIPGVYERFGKEYGGKTGETYGRALLHMGIEGGNQAIETIYRCTPDPIPSIAGKGWSFAHKLATGK
jgi:hypothetical protein